PERYLWWMNLGVAYRRAHLAERSREANQHGLALAERELARDPRIGRVRANLAYLCARLGERRRAESEVAQALQLSPSDADTLWSAVITYEALDRREDTLAVLRKSPSGLIAELSRWPDLADLRQDPRFSALSASREIK